MPLVKKAIQIDEVNMLNTLTKQRTELNKQLRELSVLINKTTREIHNIKNGDSEQERKQFIMPCPADNCKGYPIPKISLHCLRTLYMSRMF